MVTSALILQMVGGAGFLAGVAYSHNGTDPASYVVTGVRKAPARRSR